MTGWVGQQRTLLVCQPLVRGAHHTDRQARGVRCLFELERVPGGDRRGDPGGIGRHIQEAAPPGDQMRIDGRCHDPAAVRRAVGRHEERVVEHERVRGHLPVQRRVPEGAGIDGVHGLAQVEVEVLRRATPMAMEGDRRDGPGHERDADAGAEPVRRRHDRILSGEGDGGPRPPSWRGRRPQAGRREPSSGSKSPACVRVPQRRRPLLAVDRLSGVDDR